jgi:predicted ATP-binding protein involved in virulence
VKRLRIENLGPLRRADVTLGDLTVLVGPQASGKSLFVQTYKAICDAQSIRSDLRSYGFDWKTSDDPKAIVSFGLLVLELLHRGYRVIVSTHSPVFLDVVWAVRQLSGVRRNHARAALKKIFGLRTLTAPLQQVFENALDAEYRTYFFERKPRGVVVKEISTLDPGDEDPHVSGWGGLSGFSGEIAEAVGEAMSK